MAVEVTRTCVGSIENQQQVRDDLNLLGDSASKLWNVARWTADRIWNQTGEVPDEGTLKAYMKNQECWKDLNAQSSQKVIEELSDAFQSWFDLRQTDSETNPPGYRKHGNERPRSTVTFKTDGFRLDTDNNRVRLSKGSNLKHHRSDFTLCEYTTRPDVDLSEVNRVQNVRAVWNGDEWELHFVYKVELEPDNSAGDGVAGVTLGNSTIASVAFPSEYVLYPGNTLKEDAHYFTQAEGGTERLDTPTNQARRTLTKRETHFYHVLTSTIITECVDRGVGTLAVRWPNGADVEEKRANGQTSHSWAYDRIYQHLKYKGKDRGVEVLKEAVETGAVCSECGSDAELHSVEPGLYGCSVCELVANADCNLAENVRQRVTPSPHGEDRSTGCVAQPSIRLFDRERGTFTTRGQAVS